MYPSHLMKIGSPMILEKPQIRRTSSSVGVNSVLPSEMFEKTYPNAEEFKQAVAMLNEGETQFASLQSKRIGITN